MIAAISRRQPFIAYQQIFQMFNILILLALQFFILPKDKCKMLTKMLTLSKVHQIETSSIAGTRVQVIVRLSLLRKTILIPEY